jgi:hypothetical protein
MIGINSIYHSLWIDFVLSKNLVGGVVLRLHFEKLFILRIGPLGLWDLIGFLRVGLGG